MQITSYKKKDGKTYYAIRVYLGLDPKTGKERKVMKKGFASRKDAQLAYHAIEIGDDLISILSEYKKQSSEELVFSNTKNATLQCLNQADS